MTAPAATIETEKDTQTHTIALVGNPNTGKSTVFNALCGTRQKVGNYPGVTVEKKLGRLTLGDQKAELLDLPGVYSLNAMSPDERIAVEAMTGKVPGTARPDLVLFVMDATNIKRNLLLYSQIAELDLPTVVILTMTDLLAREGIEVNVETLTKKLGVPVIRLVGRNQEQLAELRRTAAHVIENPVHPRTAIDWPASVNQAMDHVKQVDRAVPSDFEIRGRLLNRNGLMYGDPPPQWLAERLDEARRFIPESDVINATSEAGMRYKWADSIIEAVEKRRTGGKTSLSQRIDKVLVHRLFGPIIFAAIMYFVFQSIYTWAVPFMDLIDGTFAALGDFASSRLAGTPLLQSLVTDGIIGGVGSVVIFLPQILILFLFVAVLEDSGYLSRAAFLMDKLLSWTGLNGRAFIPMLSGFACAVPAIMAARVMPDPKARLATILITPLMSCSARLPVYLLLISAFIEPKFGPGWAAFSLFAMHALGLFLALAIAFILNRGVLKTPPLPFILEMPAYRLPHVYNVVYRAYQAGRKFLLQAGTIIFACSVLIWALSYFPRPDSVREELQATHQANLQTNTGLTESQQQEMETKLEQKIAGAYLEQSYLGRAGKLVQPIFAPLGYDWKISVGILGAFPAREVIIATLGIVYSVGDVDENDVSLKDAMAQAEHENGNRVFTPLVAISLMIFFALCSQCMSTLATVKRELNSWRWTAFLFVYMTVLAYVSALVVYQGGKLFGFS